MQDLWRGARGRLRGISLPVRLLMFRGRNCMGHSREMRQSN